MRVRNVPVWALLFCIPVALLAINCGPVDLGADQNDTNVVMNDDLKQVVDAKDMEVSNDATNNDLNLEEGATDEWRWGRGWGGRFGRWGGWGGWGGNWGGWGLGSFWPYGGYSWSWPSWGYPSYWY